MKKSTVKNRTQKKHRVSCLKTVCWIVVPVIVAALLTLDALGIYSFSAERLIVLGIYLLVILLPFFSEIDVKGIVLKRDKPKKGS